MPTQKDLSLTTAKANAFDRIMDAFEAGNLSEYDLLDTVEDEIDSIKQLENKNK